MDDRVTFQLATHYLPKIALRLDTLIRSIVIAQTENHSIIHHYALRNILEIIQLIEKPELKGRFLKELIRIEHLLKKKNPASSSTLQVKLEQHIHFLSHVVGLFGEGIQNDSFLQSIRTAQLTSSDFDCDSPFLQRWISLDSCYRQKDLERWLKKLDSLIQTVSIYLEILKDQAEEIPINDFSGFYQRALPKNFSHLIILSVQKTLNIVPKMQINNYGLSLLLYDGENMREIQETSASLNLSICQL